jgi:hypothetical protein
VRGLDVGDILDELESLPWRQLDDQAADEFYDLVARAARLEA